jgi:hypothetical protein
MNCFVSARQCKNQQRMLLEQTMATRSVKPGGERERAWERTAAAPAWVNLSRTWFSSLNVGGDGSMQCTCGTGQAAGVVGGVASLQSPQTPQSPPTIFAGLPAISSLECSQRVPMRCGVMRLDDDGGRDQGKGRRRTPLQ